MTVRKIFFNVLGTLFVGLGIAGIILPLVPATPFLLLASACYLRGSERLHNWLMNHRLMGPYLRNFKEQRAMPLAAKIGTIAILWISIIASVIAIERLSVRITLVAIALCTSTYVLRLKTLRRAEKPSAEGPATTERPVPTEQTVS